MIVALWAGDVESTTASTATSQEKSTMKLNKILGAFTALTFLAVPACDDKKDEKKDDKKADEKKAEDKADDKAEDKAEEKAEEKKEEGDEGGGGSDKIGVPECDEYVEKYTKCIDEKMPEGARDATREAMQMTVDAWKEAAKGPGKDAMAEGCKIALDAAKKGSEAFGCEW
jgi:hypothetical protein